MPTKKSLANISNDVTRTAQVSISDTTVDDILAAQTQVGAPNTARVSTGGANYNPGNDDNYQYSVTFTWTETL